MKKLLTLCVAAAVFFSGCASIVSGTKQRVNVSSLPSEANVVIYDRENVKIAEATTPRTFQLRRGDGMCRGAKYRVEISKEGYAPQTIQITSRVNGWYIGGNILLGTFLGWLIVDPATGAMWTLTPQNVNADLQGTHGGMDFSGNNENIEGIHVILKEQIPEEVFERLELVKLN